MPLTELERFSISHLQVLDEAGVVDAELDPALSEEELLRLYRAMLLAREGDQRMIKLQRQGRIGTFAPCSGHEAVSVGAAVAMTERDWFAGAFRELGGLLVRGMTLADYFVFLNGYEEGNVWVGGGRTLPVSIIVGAQTLHAVGIAYAMRYRGEHDSAAVTIFGDGASSQGDVHEAMNFAATWRLPVVFLCQNNQWAISVPRSKQAHNRTLAQRAIGYDMAGIQVDGNDVLAVYRATREALVRAREGGGPTLIEALTYRLEMHTTSDDPSRYREEAEVEAWRAREPLLRFRKYLEGRGLLDEARHEAILAEVAAELNGAVQDFERRTDFPADAPFEHVFGTRHEAIEEQRAELLRRLREEAADA